MLYISPSIHPRGILIMPGANRSIHTYTGQYARAHINDEKYVIVDPYNEKEYLLSL